MFSVFFFFLRCLGFFYLLCVFISSVKHFVTVKCAIKKTSLLSLVLIQLCEQIQQIRVEPGGQAVNGKSTIFFSFLFHICLAKLGVCFTTCMIS